MSVWPSRYAIRGAILLTLLCAPSIVVTAAAQSPLSNQQRNSTATVNATVSHFSMLAGSQEVQFSIPKEYFTLSPIPSAGLQDVFSISATISTGASLLRTQMSTADKDVVRIALYSIKSYNLDRIVEHHLSHDWIEIQENDDEEFHHYILEEDRTKYTDQAKLLKIYLVPRQKTETNTRYFSCLRETGNPKVGCTGFSVAWGSLSLEYTFRRTELRRWREIEARVGELLHRFSQR